MSNNRNRHKSKRNTSLVDSLNQLRYPEAYRISEGETALFDLKPEIQNLVVAQQVEKTQASADMGAESAQLLKLIADIGTGIWRTRLRMLQPGTDQPLEEMRRPFRPLAAAYDTLVQAGFEIKDRTHTPYASGMIETVIAFEPTPNLLSEMVIETIKPTILYQGKLLQRGDIIVGTPSKAISEAPPIS